MRRVLMFAKPKGPLRRLRSSFLFFRINFWTFRLFGRKILNQDSKTQAMRGAAKIGFPNFFGDNPLMFHISAK